MTRDDLLALRATLQTQVTTMRGLGDYDVNAKPLRTALEACLLVVQHLLDRTRK